MYIIASNYNQSSVKLKMIKCIFNIVFKIDKSNYFYGRYGIRTHEANADDLKSSPFDRSGNLPILSDLSDRSLSEFFFKSQLFNTGFS